MQLPTKESMTRHKGTPAPKHEVRSFKLSSLPIEVRTATDGSRSISGIAAPFSKRSLDLNGFTEIIAPGAFTRTLEENPDVLCLRDHDQSILLGRTKSGTLTLAEVAAGLRFTCKLPNTTQAADLIESLARKDIDSCSFGFRTVKDDWSVTADGTVIRTLLDVDLFEISVVSFPAYPDATAALRSCPPSLRRKLKADPISDDADDDDPDSEDENEDEDDDTDDSEDRCACPCQECQDGDCDECTNEDCEDDDCSCDDDYRADTMRVRSIFARRMAI